MALNPKQAAFVAAYIGEAKGNATEAARIAGYAKPGQQGHALLKKLEIQSQIDAHLSEVKRRGIAHKQNRIDALVERHNLIMQVVAERAKDPDVSGVPGGSTGLVVRQLKNVSHHYEKDPNNPRSKDIRVIEEKWEASLDTGLLRELREHEKQIAQELGEWSDKSEVQHSGRGGGPMEFVAIDVPAPQRPESEPS